MILQLLDRFDPAQSHKAQQGKNLQRCVVTAQWHETTIEVSEEAVLFERGQGTQHAAEGDIAAGFVSRGCSSGQQADSRRHAFHQPRTGDAKTIGGRYVLQSSLGLVGGFGAGASGVVRFLRRRSVLGWSSRTGTFGEFSFIDRFAKGVELDLQFLGGFLSRVSLVEQILGLLDDLVGHHGRATPATRLIKGFASLLAILLDGSLDADGRDAKRLDDIGLFADTVADELGGEHPERVAIIDRMRKYREDASEPSPPVVFVDDTDVITDGGGPIGDQR